MVGVLAAELEGEHVTVHDALSDQGPVQVEHVPIGTHHPEPGVRRLRLEHVQPARERGQHLHHRHHTGNSHITAAFPGLYGDP